jgi:hypothetical protein
MRSELVSTHGQLFSISRILLSSKSLQYKIKRIAYQRLDSFMGFVCSTREFGYSWPCFERVSTIQLLPTTMTASKNPHYTTASLTYVRCTPIQIFLPIREDIEASQGVRHGCHNRGTTASLTSYSIL